jgi:hypothetical protein
VPKSTRPPPIRVIPADALVRLDELQLVMGLPSHCLRRRGAAPPPTGIEAIGMLLDHGRLGSRVDRSRRNKKGPQDAKTGAGPEWHRRLMPTAALGQPAALSRTCAMSLSSRNADHNHDGDQAAEVAGLPDYYLVPRPGHGRGCATRCSRRT